MLELERRGAAMLTGRGLAALRKAAGMTQGQLAAAAGIGRHAVSYWETKPVVDRNGWAVKRIAGIIGLPDYYPPNARARRSITPDPAPADLEAKLRNWHARRRIRCGAKTRKGTPCRCKSEPGKRRCKFHGGLSTGPKTPEGREAIAEAQRRRWARWRAAQDGGSP
ncbi:MAG TPA: helix-turn-helix transcriptional regulator [Pararhodobacter sp.]|uniref:helix-turn-helix transcriptional regulator n=1 Tax=Pararhodobacter sp. TaxID=2127056 RepID=UPI001E1859A8|nr:helix-turn-helix transcriptional regulator [Pararhodobacter sp.]MCB1345151.1 helix-turn-helix transcriptional regulator [Paracoccaceae bacterium]HPD91069.1 helix-turn-helix transcriptional regulator [Pararhodobacter sp.]